MDKKVKSKSGKKRYSKPQITRVKVAVTKATLGACWADEVFPDSATCYTTCPT